MDTRNTEPLPDGDAAVPAVVGAGVSTASVADSLDVTPVPTGPAASEDQWAGFDDDSPLPPRKPRALTPLSYALVAGLLATGGFALGAKVGRDSAPKAAANPAAAFAAAARAAAGGATTTVAGARGATTTVAGGAAAAAAAAAGGTGRQGGFGGAGGGTFGTVKLIDGTNVYIQDASGNVIKVTTSADSAITVSKRGTTADLKAGDTIVVQGATDGDGNIAATAITSAAGLGGARNGGGTGANAGGTGAGAATGTGANAAAGAGGQTPAAPAAGPTTTAKG